MTSLGEQMQDLERRLDQLERLAPEARASAGELVRVLLGFHHAGLARLLGAVERAGALTEALNDEVVVDLLLLHGLHPTSLQTRAGHALTRLSPVFAALGVEVELAQADENTLHVLVRGGTTEAADAVHGALAAALPDTDLFLQRSPLRAGADGRFSLPLLEARSP